MEHYRPYGARREFPKRWYITDKRCAWNRDEVERWLDERQAASPAEFQGKSLLFSNVYIVP